MTIKLILSAAAALATPLAHAQEFRAPAAPSPEPPPLLNDLEKTDNAEPKKAPPGKLCLVDAPQRCGEEAELIQKPYTGGAELYYLERQPQKAEQKPPEAPPLKPAPN
jgi:hypothetical protein